MSRLVPSLEKQTIASQSGGPEAIVHGRWWWLILRSCWGVRTWTVVAQKKKKKKKTMVRDCCGLASSSEELDYQRLIWEVVAAVTMEFRMAWVQGWYDSQ